MSNLMSGDESSQDSDMEECVPGKDETDVMCEDSDIE